MSGGERPARSTPLSRICPESGLSAPVIRLKNVLLPAPLGPITAVSDPSGKSSETLSVALTPPNDFERERICSMANLFPLLRHSGMVRKDQTRNLEVPGSRYA